jgi:protein-L-isoaspartate(D-aspartate) O-methyltransferase
MYRHYQPVKSCFSNQGIIAKKIDYMKKNTGRNNKEDLYLQEREYMVTSQIISRGVSDPGVLDVMRKVPREVFVPPEYRGSAYEDRPLPIGMGQTISQPYIVALMTEQLEVKKDMKVLEVGTGSGYQAAILAELADKVYSVEIKEGLCKRNAKLLKKYSNLKLSCHDGAKGWKEYAPYDRIMVTAAPSQIPSVYIDQLKAGGIMVIPVGSSTWSQELIKVIKTKTGIKKKKICDVAFVPLIGKY